MRLVRSPRLAARLAVIATAALSASHASGQYATIVGGPAYVAPSGYRSSYLGPSTYPDPALNTLVGNGVAIGSAGLQSSSGTNLGLRAIRIDRSGGVELQPLGVDANGVSTTTAYAINADGAVVGSSNQYDANGTLLGERAVRWNADKNTAVPLDVIATPAGATLVSRAFAINASGMSAGASGVYATDGTYLGPRAVRWAAQGTALTTLGVISTTSAGLARSSAYAMNDAGTAVGYGTLFSDSGTSLGNRAVRWDADSTVATKLDDLGTTPSGVSNGHANAVNFGGTAVGSETVYSSSGTSLGPRAVRWDAGGTAATQLDALGTTSTGSSQSAAESINASGTAVGYSLKYSAAAGYLGIAAVRWDAGTKTATELPNLLPPFSPAATGARAYAINDAGIAVGQALALDGNLAVAYHAVAWGPDAVPIDLQSFVDPTSGWTLQEALSISKTNWVTGIGQYDPDGVGPAAAYTRTFLIQIPEPATLAGVFGATFLFRRRRAFLVHSAR